MADIAPSIPAVGELNSTADPKIRTALNALIATVNALDTANFADGSVTADKIIAATAATLGLNQTGTTRRGRFRQATESSVITSTSYTDPSNGPDKIASLVVPSGGIIWAYFRGVWRATNVGAPTTQGAAAFFLGSNQMKKTPLGATAPLEQDVSLTSSIGAAATGDAILITNANGLTQPFAADNNAANDASFLADASNTGQALGTFFPIEVDAGTYDLSVKYKAAASGNVYVKDRLLLAFVQDFA